MIKRIFEIATGILIAGIVLGTFWFAYVAHQRSETNKADIVNIVNFLNAKTQIQE